MKNLNEMPIGALEREYNQLLDQHGILQDRVQRLLRRQAAQLTALENQAVVIAQIHEYIEDKDMVRVSELRPLVEQLLGNA